VTALLGSIELVVLDCEASSLDQKRSWPTEVGWCVIKADNGELICGPEAYLIRPAPQWMDWSLESAAIHGIGLEELLARGRPVREVALRLLTVATGRLVVSDSHYDELWVARLFRAAGIAERLFFRDFDASLRTHITLLRSTRCDNAQENVLGEAGRCVNVARLAAAYLSPPTHRAGPDALYLAEVWRLACSH
jgi:hypothetical protein